VSAFVHGIDPNHEGLSHVTTGYEVALTLLSEKRLVGLDSISPNPKGKVNCLNRLTLEHIEIKDKRILLRADFRLPERGGLGGEEDVAFKDLVGTIKTLLKRNVYSIVLFGHIGNPRGKRDDALSINFIKTQLERALRMEIPFFDKGLTDSVEMALMRPEPGKLYMLENMRFNPEEDGYELNALDRRTNIPYEQIETYRNRLSKCGDVFINESMSALNTTDSSIVGINLQNRAVGPRLKMELNKFNQLLPRCEAPILALVGGDNIVRQTNFIYKLLDVVHDVIIYGSVAFTFLKVYKGMAIGKSSFDTNAAKLVPRIIKKAQVNGIGLHFPVDFKVPAPTDSLADGAELTEDELTETFTIEQGIPDSRKAMDIGEESLAEFIKLIQAAKTIVFVGFAGVYSQETFAQGTKGIIQAIGEAVTENEAVSIAFGPRTAICLNTLEGTSSFSHVSYSYIDMFVNLMTGHYMPGLGSLSFPPEKPLSVMTIHQANLKGQKVLIRFDLDVPTVEGVVLDTDKIELALPTIRYVLEKEALCVIIAGFRGEPGGYKNSYLSMKPLAGEFEHFLERPVTFLEAPCSGMSRMAMDDLTPGSVFLLENLKFYPAELGFDEGVTDILDNTGSQNTEPEPGHAGGDEMEEVKRENIDKLMWELMPPKTIEQYTREIGDLTDMFIMDDVTHMNENFVSNKGFDLPTRVAGLVMVDHLLHGGPGDANKSIAVSALSAAPK